jgi:hypothetical protein
VKTRSPCSGPEAIKETSEGAVLLIGVVMLVVLVPLVIGVVSYPWTAFASASLLLGLAAFVRPQGRAASLRWIPLCLGLLALIGGAVQLVS